MWYDDLLPSSLCFSNHLQPQKGNLYFFLPEDLGSEQGVGRQVLREDLVVADKVLGGLLKFGSPCDAP